MPTSPSHLPTTPQRRAAAVLRFLCLITALANIGGNIAILATYRHVLPWLGLPLPSDPHAFYAVSGFSLLMGVAAYLVWRDPPRSLRLLGLLVLGKTSYALYTFYFFAFSDLSWFWMLFGAWDAFYAGVFALYMIHLTRPELAALNAGAILPGRSGSRSKRALIVYYSLSGNGSRAINALARGLAEGDYTCTMQPVVPIERTLFRFPFTSWRQGLGIVARAYLRVPAAIEPIAIEPAAGPYDLVVFESQTWMLGLSAPMEAVFTSDAGAAVRAAVRGRDVALINVSRGLWQRSQAMLAAGVDRAGGHIVATSGHTNPGREPLRLLSLALFLIFGEEGRPRWLARWLTPQRIDAAAEADLVALGQRLAERPARPARAANEEPS